MKEAEDFFGSFLLLYSLLFFLLNIPFHASYGRCANDISTHVASVISSQDDS